MERRAARPGRRRFSVSLPYFKNGRIKLPRRRKKEMRKHLVAQLLVDHGDYRDWTRLHWQPACGWALTIAVPRHWLRHHAKKEG